MMDGWGMGWGVGWILMVLFWVFAIAGIVWAVLTLSRSAGIGGAAGGAKPALRVLEERLARGEIDLEEFRTKKQAIERG